MLSKNRSKVKSVAPAKRSAGKSDAKRPSAKAAAQKPGIRAAAKRPSVKAAVKRSNAKAAGRRPRAKSGKRTFVKSVSKVMNFGSGKSGIKVLTTGVLNTVANQTAAHIEVTNFNQSRNAQVTVQVYSWNTGSPQLLLNREVTIPPNTFESFTQDITPFHYEVRIIQSTNDNVVANTFAIDGDFNTLPGLTFNQGELIRLRG